MRTLLIQIALCLLIWIWFPVLWRTYIVPPWVKAKMEADRLLNSSKNEANWHGETWAMVAGPTAKNFSDTLIIFNAAEKLFPCYDSVDFKLIGTWKDSSMYLLNFFSYHLATDYDGKSHYDKFVITNEHYKL